MTHSTKLDLLGAALVAVKAKMQPIRRTARSEEGWHYAPLEEVLSARNTRLLARHGLALTQACEMAGAGAIVTTMLLHKSGQWIKATLELPMVDRTDPRSVASAMTLARRYGALAALGVATEDDDGYKAQHDKGRQSMKEQALRARDISTAAQRLVDARQQAHKEGNRETVNE